MSLDVSKIKIEFPILSRTIDGKRLVYLDNAATTQKPLAVINSISDYYSQHNSNVHRGVHALSDESTTMYDEARETVAKFIGAARSSEIIFTKNASDSLNIVAMGWGLNNLKNGDVILTTISEHNSSVLPWQLVSKKTGAVLDYIYLNETGELDFVAFKKQVLSFNGRVKVLVISHASNVLGTVFDIKAICRFASEQGIVTVVDGAQSIPHLKVNVTSLDCDFYGFSAHKMLGPMGVGVLYGKSALLEKMPPVQLGGGTVLDVDLQSFELLPVPERFEAGTPDVAGAVGLSAAIKYLENIGLDAIRDHEIAMSQYLLENLSKIKGLTILGSMDPKARTGLVAFTMDGIHPHDLGSVLNSEGVAVRSGMHCAMNLHKALHIPSSTRVSYYIYNDTNDLDVLILGINKAIKMFL